jgi:hypothetical protein
MANKSSSISSGFNWLVGFLAQPLLARPKRGQERCAPCPEQQQPPAPAGEEIILTTWPDLPTRAADPRERMQADLARLHRSTFINNIR